MVLLFSYYRTIIAGMIDIIKLNNNDLKLVDSENKFFPYIIPGKELIKESQSNPSCSEWIIHLVKKSYIDSNNKTVFYDLAKIIEKERPRYFDWRKTFYEVEKEVYLSEVVQLSNKENEDESEDFDIDKWDSDDWGQIDDLETVKAINLNVFDNLTKHGLPFKK